MARMPELTGGELSMLRSFAAGPRIWDAVSLQPQVTVLSELGLIEPAVPRNSYRLTQAGRQVLGMVPGPPVPEHEREDGAASRQLEEIRSQARRYMEARYGENVWFKAPETFANAVERWIWAVASGAPEIAEESVIAIEQHFAQAASGESPG